jgi:phosphatidylserine/phosphatidylglycerophosphate/cardiolipin synthase-like enzyme
MKMRTALVALLTALATVLALGAPVQAAAPAQVEKATAKKWLPKAGGSFNNPYGDGTARRGVERTITQAITRAPKGSVIRITLFSFDRVNMAKALIDARKRGVTVQLLLNSHQFTKAMRMLRNSGLRADPTRKNFMYQCKRGCRGGSFLHSKMYLFSESGAAKHTVMVGSHNLTTNATVHQWNDLWVRNNDRELFIAFRKTFNQMRRDRNATPLYQVHNVHDGRFQLQVMPHPGTTKQNDPIMKMLRRVECRGAAAGTGTNGRTAIRVSQHRWAGKRGAWIARKLVQLYGQGCDVKLMHGSADKYVRPALNIRSKRGLVPVRTNGFDHDGDGYLDVYSHHKYMTISGVYGKDKDARITMTGSSNWAGIGMHGDELIFVARGAKFVRQWNANWNFIWKNHSQPTEYRRVAAGFRAVAPPIAGGEHWEND